jgi:hypothetical protein
VTNIFLANKVVRFWLSPEGKIALKGVFDKEAFQAYVHSVDDLGAWIQQPAKRGQGFTSGNSLLLLKWDYFSTAHFDIGPVLSKELVDKVH